MVLLLIFFFFPSPSTGYAPELLLQKTMVPGPELKAPGGLQFFNPFSEVQASYTRLEFGKDKHEYGLQLKPKGFGESFAYGRLIRSLASNATVTEKVLRSENLRVAYQALIHAALAKDQLVELSTLKDLMEKSQKLSSLAARRSQTDIKNVIKANADLHKSLSEIISTEEQIESIRSFLDARGLELDSLDTSDILRPDESQLQPGKDPPLSSLKVLSDLELTRAGISHSYEERSGWLDGFKLAFRQESNDHSFRLEVTFNLPFLAAQSTDDYKDALKLAESEMKAHQELMQAGRRLPALARVIEQKISLYRLMERRAEAPPPRLLRQDPVLALELERTESARRLALASLLAEIRSLYIDYLFENGILSDRAELNHLSRSGRKI